MATWTNWAGNHSASGLRTSTPRSVEEVSAAVVEAAERQEKVKVVGSGHSFSDIARPEGVVMDLSSLNRLHAWDRRSGTVTVGAGVELRRLNDLLAGVGLALPNLGDVDTQTLAGAVATGTHGTGEKFPVISAGVTALEMVLADGSVVRCSSGPLWSAGRVGLGALGVVTEITLQCVPLFNLHAEESTVPLDELLARFDELAASHDHFEAWWFPHTRMAYVKANTRLPLVEGLDRLPAWRQWIDDELLANRLFSGMVALGRRRPDLVPRLNTVAARALGQREYTDLSYKVFTSPRRVPFKEMELALPRAVATEAVREVVTALDRSGEKVTFPVEVRIGAADDIPVSPASGRDTVFLAFHTPAGADHTSYFKLVSRVLDPYQARPHWGKIHDLDAELLRTRYPRFDEFVQIRNSVDPDGRFSNRYLDRVLGPSRAA